MKQLEKRNVFKVAYLFLFICLFSLFFIAGCNDEPVDNPDDGEVTGGDLEEVEIKFGESELKITEETEFTIDLKKVELSQINFSVGDPTIVSVNENKIIPLSAGKTEVTASYNNVSTKMVVIVLPTMEKELSVGDEIVADSKLEYSVADQSVLSVEDGKIKAIKAGVTNVTITLKSDSTISNVITVVVSGDSIENAPKCSYTQKTIVVDNEVFVGLEDEDNDNFKWEINDNSLAVLYDDYYLSVTKIGTLVITITSLSNPAEVYHYTFEIIPDQPRVSLSKNLVVVGDELELEFNNEYELNDVKVTSSDEEIVKFENGKLIAVSEGTATITVANKEYPDSYTTTNVTVYSVEPIISVATDKIEVGTTLKVNIINYTEGYSVEIDDESILKYEKGLITALKEGTTIVNVYLESDPSIFSQVEIEVMPVKPEISLTYPIIIVGNETGFIITNLDELMYKEYSDYSVTSNNTQVATVVNNEGIVTIRGIKKGNCDIVVIAKENQNIQTNVSIEVVNASDNVLYASLDGISSIIKTGDMVAIKVKGSTDLSSYQIVTSDIGKATVTDKGKLVTTSQGIVSVTVVLKTDKNVKFTMTFSIEGEPNINFIDRIISIAEEEIGYVEGSNNDTKYGDWYGMPNAAWCAMFVSWCANQAGISTNIIPKYASCALGRQWFESRGQFKYKKDYTPKAGDIIFFLSDGASHTGLVIACEGGTVYTIEGNTSNKVAKRYYNLSKSTITGYGVPNYPKYDGTVSGGGTGGATDGGGESTT